MNKANLINDILNLVCLQMTYKMPLCRQNAVILVPYLLRLILADVRYTKLYSLVHHFGRVSFCNGNKRYIFTFASAPLSRRTYSLFNFFKIFRYTHFYHSFTYLSPTTILSICESLFSALSVDSIIAYPASVFVNKTSQ